MLGYTARKEAVLRQRVAQRRERAEGAVREISSLEVEMAEIREMEIEMERRELREMREVTSLPIGLTPTLTLTLTLTLTRTLTRT